MPRAVVLLNPHARGGARPPLNRVLRAFEAAGWDAEVWAGSGSGWTEEAARRAVGQGVAAIFGAGGDGVLADVLPAVLDTDVALGVVPLGTGNVWARELGLPLDVQGAIGQQLAAPPARVDVGRANGRPFLVIASAGFDAEIVKLVESGTKVWGQVAYPLAGLSLATTVRGTRCRVQFDDEEPLELDLLVAIVTNGRLYGGVVSLAPRARLDDGLLDVVLFAGAGAVEAAAHAARAIAGLHLGDSTTYHRRMHRLRVESLSAPMPVQTDGDVRGTTPLDAEVLPGALLALGAGQRGSDPLPTRGHGHG